ncbi:MAG: FtsW/RodA/SpoVE family cell cycle protein [Dysgonamonadaceae bacterium]|jgi:cell division protein FtsW|nr:FtsW/RodA/SpoVE family cell cycle protein [Dysgonamonadaceae bacterium]
MNTISKIIRRIAKPIIGDREFFLGDKVIWSIFLLLSIISIIEVYSASSPLTFNTNYWVPIFRHVRYLALGFVFVLVIVHKFEPKYFSIFMAGIIIIWILLILTKIFGKEVNEGQREIFRIQPSEWAKPCLIASTAFLMMKFKETGKDLYYKLILWLSIPTCLLIAPDNISNGIIIFVIVCLILFIGQLPDDKMKKLLGTCSVIVITISIFTAATPNETLMMSFNIEVEKTDTINNKEVPRIDTIKVVPFKRLVTVKNRTFRYCGIPEDYFAVKFFGATVEEKAEKEDNSPLSDKNRQVTMSKVAIARGGLFNLSIGQSQRSDDLSQSYSDFIYAIIIEETGLLGGIAVLTLYIILLIRAGNIAHRCNFLFPKLLVMGSVLMIVVQALVHMAVSVDLIPVTGQPLPLISRGVNSTLVTCIFIGIILNVSRFENSADIKGKNRVNKDTEEYETDYNTKLA